MAKKYNAAHFIHIFKIGHVVIVAIPAENWAVNNAPRMKVHIIDTQYKNRHTMQTKYGILTNSYPTSKFNQVPAELAAKKIYGYITFFYLANKSQICGVALTYIDNTCKMQI